jgi:hypothetical protein
LEGQLVEEVHERLGLFVEHHERRPLARHHRVVLPNVCRAK